MLTHYLMSEWLLSDINKCHFYVNCKVSTSRCQDSLIQSESTQSNCSSAGSDLETGCDTFKTLQRNRFSQKVFKNSSSAHLKWQLFLNTEWVAAETSNRRAISIRPFTQMRPLDAAWWMHLNFNCFPLFISFCTKLRRCIVIANHVSTTTWENVSNKHAGFFVVSTRAS